MINIFEFKSYQNYLEIKLASQRGLKSGASEYVGIQTSYLSRVLQKQAHLSLEQSYSLNLYLNHDQQESEFFLLLVQMNRAGTKDLESYFQKKIDEIIKTRQQLKSRIDVKEEMTPLDQARYYSHWLYSALHILCSIPNFKNRESIYKLLDLPPEFINQALEFLVSSGLLQKTDGQYELGPRHLHLPNDSPYILQHHSNWRNQCLKQLDYHQPDNFHYSGVFSLSEKDAKLLRERMLLLVQENLKTIAPSKEEVLYCSLFDFFKIA